MAVLLYFRWLRLNFRANRDGAWAASLQIVSGVRRFEELHCWQLANQFKLRIYRLADRPIVARDFRFRNQIVDAAASGPRNIAEGFARRTHADFAHFLDIARGSLTECQNHLRDAVDREYLSAAECEELAVLSKRACGAVAALQRYLRRRPGPPR